MVMAHQRENADVWQMLTYDRKVSALSVPHYSKPHSEPVFWKQHFRHLSSKSMQASGNADWDIQTPKSSRMCIPALASLDHHLLRLWISPPWGSQGTPQDPAPGWTLCFRSCLSLNKEWVCPSPFGDIGFEINLQWRAYCVAFTAQGAMLSHRTDTDILLAALHSE